MQGVSKIARKRRAQREKKYARTQVAARRGRVSCGARARYVGGRSGARPVRRAVRLRRTGCACGAPDLAFFLHRRTASLHSEPV